MKKYIIFDLDGTLIESMSDAVRIILEHLSKIPETDIEKAKYIFSTTPGMALKNQIELIYNGIDNINSEEVTNRIYEDLLSHDADFFEGVIEKVIELKNEYKLFLTTGNSTLVAEKHLKKGGIIEHFELIYGSDKILKGMEHLNIFKEHTNDEHFFSKSIYVGDGQSDRIFASQAGIDFIHIGNEGKDVYEVNSVVEIDKILNKFRILGEK